MYYSTGKNVIQLSTENERNGDLVGYTFLCQTGRESSDPFFYCVRYLTVCLKTRVPRARECAVVLYTLSDLCQNPRVNQ